MSSGENSDWIFDGSLVDDFAAAAAAAAAAAEFSAPPGAFFWASPAVEDPSDCCVKTSDPSLTCNNGKERCSSKRLRQESLTQPSSKACREKLRRDKLNERFLELASVLEPGKTPKLDKSAILNEAVRMVTELRGESQNLMDSNKSLQEKIKELKAEKNELRDEKQRLKAEKERLEQQIKMLNAHANLMAHPPVIPAAFAAPGQFPGQKMMPFIGYPGFPMWQFMAPTDVDTSQDPDSCPPVA